MAGSGMAGGSHSDGGHGGEGAGKVEHITNMSACFGDKLGLKDLKKGQKWNLKAFYDYDK